MPLTAHACPDIQRPVFTAQARFTPSSVHSVCALSDYALLFSRVQRALFARLAAGENAIKIKPAFMVQHGLSARQYNAMRSEAEAKAEAIIALRNEQIETLETRISKLKKEIKKTKAALARHGKKRKLYQLEGRLEKLKADKANGKVRLCFGTKKLFHAQFHLKDGGFTNHAEWKAAWQKSRNSQFFVLGSKDETSGCASCLATVVPDSSLTLSIRLPHCLTHTAPPNTLFCKQDLAYIAINNIFFNYGHNQILAALNAGQAISYRFLKDNKGWRAFASTDAAEVETTSRDDIGRIGVDINDNFLSVSDIDRHGNAVETFRIPCDTYGKSANQTQTIVGEAVKQLRKIASDRNKPIARESLDFSKKKAQLEGESAARCRQLSSFAYSLIGSTIDRGAYRDGTAVDAGNPAYTSTIGAINYARRYGITTHAGAAIAIARRSLGFREKPLSENGKVNFSFRDGVQGTFPLPARNRGKHVWTLWAAVSRKLKAAHAAHAKLAKSKKPKARPLKLMVVSQSSSCPILGGAGGKRQANRRKARSATLDECP